MTTTHRGIGIDTEISQRSDSATGTSGRNGRCLRVQKESAILATYSRREAGVFTLLQTHTLGAYLGTLTQISGHSMSVFGTHMEL